MTKPDFELDLSTAVVELARAHPVEIEGFATFRRRDIAERRGTDPKTQEPFVQPARTILEVRPDSDFDEALSSQSTYRPRRSAPAVVARLTAYGYEAKHAIECIDRLVETCIQQVQSGNTTSFGYLATVKLQVRKARSLPDGSVAIPEKRSAQFRVSPWANRGLSGDFPQIADHKWIESLLAQGNEAPPAEILENAGVPRRSADAGWIAEMREAAPAMPQTLAALHQRFDLSKLPAHDFRLITDPSWIVELRDHLDQWAADPDWRANFDNFHLLTPVADREHGEVLYVDGNFDPPYLRDPEFELMCTLDDWLKALSVHTAICAGAGNKVLSPRQKILVTQHLQTIAPGFSWDYF